MTPLVTDWFRSLGVFGTAFAAVVVCTVGIAAAIVPSADGLAQVPTTPTTSPRSPAATPMPTVPAQPTAVGGTLTVSGDRQGTLVLERETTQDRYGLVGPDGRLLFGGDPVGVARVQYDGLEFFVDPDECTVVPGERHDPSGVAGADISCEAIEDVRGNGTIGLEGRVGVAATLFGLRGDLPESGGSVALGDEQLTFEAAVFTITPFGQFGGGGVFAGQLVDMEVGAYLGFGYDPQTHELSLTDVGYGGDVTMVQGGCSVEEREIGRLDPHTRVVELHVRCDSIDIPTLGPVPLDGSVIVDMAEPPD